MGYNTTVFILNDRLDEIRQHPEAFTEDVYLGCLGVPGDRRHSIGQTTVMPTAHADTPRIYGTKHNSIVELSSFSPETYAMLQVDHQRDFVKSLVADAEFYLKDLKKAIKEAEAQ